MFKLPAYSVYIKINSDNQIVGITSSAFLKDPTGWIKIDEGYGLKYQLAQTRYLDQPIKKPGGAYNYKWENESIIEIPEEEKVSPMENVITQLDRVEAQMTYMAMMTDTLLEG